MVSTFTIIFSGITLSALSDDELRERLITYTCQRNCCGVAGQAGVCCTLGENDWILGPVADWNDVLERVQKRFGAPITFDDIFISFEEGAAMFPDRPAWQNPAHYPAMRVVPDAALLYPCRFLVNKACSIHDIKPNLCKSFLCEQVKKVLQSIINDS
jgi:hypothetical protein